MIFFTSLLFMLIVAYAFWQEGAFTGFCNLVNVIIASVVVANFYEPMASFIEPHIEGSIVENLEDAFSMLVLFLVTYAALRFASNQIAHMVIPYPHLAHMLGGAFFGLIVGYLAAGFLWCVFQTLPWQEKFMTFSFRVPGKNEGTVFLRPDRVWLSFMNKLSTGVFRDGKLFDPSASFEVRYLKYRRISDQSTNPKPYLGEPDFNHPSEW